jgi:hypothetical protein
MPPEAAVQVKFIWQEQSQHRDDPALDIDS